MNFQRSSQIIIERIRERKSVYKDTLLTKNPCAIFQQVHERDERYKVYPLQERTGGARTMKKVRTNLRPVLSS